MKRLPLLLGILVLAILLHLLKPYARNWVASLGWGMKTVEARVAEYGPAARTRLAPYFRDAGVAYPPALVTLVGIKDTKILQIYAVGKHGAWRLVHTYPILGASGMLGPKLREGDCQVPEGLYRIGGLNPNSRYQVSLRIGYPNDFDKAMAARDGRTELGGDIMIHGSNSSIGCLAMGDAASEALFILVADTGLDHVDVILTPTDFRRADASPLPDTPAWVSELYPQIRRALQRLPLP